VAVPVGRTEDFTAIWAVAGIRSDAIANGSGASVRWKKCKDGVAYTAPLRQQRCQRPTRCPTPLDDCQQPAPRVSPSPLRCRFDL